MTTRAVTIKVRVILPPRRIAILAISIIMTINRLFNSGNGPICKLRGDLTGYKAG